MISYTDSSLGDTLRECRTISGMTLNDTSVESGIPITHLADIESGGCGPTKEILRSLMAVYGPAIRALHALPSVDERREGSAGAEINWLDLMIRSEHMTNHDLLTEVAGAVRSLRGLEDHASVHMRKTEADLLVSMLDLDHEDLACDIMNVFGLSITTTQDFINSALQRATRRSKGTESAFLGRLARVTYPESVAV